ncbi:MAG TPA: hypothetical protein QGH10_07060 [Armatimonadota bacterium]|nr:hypothetical protein [Armatimonadota bacterium]
MGALAGGISGIAYQFFAFHMDDHRCLRPTALTMATIGFAFISAVVLPVFGPRGMAKRSSTDCASHVKQLGLAMTMYVNDNDGRYPHHRAFSASLGRDPRSSDASPDAGYLIRYAKVPWTWLCPQHVSPVDRLNRRRPVTAELVDTSYRWDADLAGRQADSVGDPATTPVMFDCEPFHNGGRYVGFVDGHAKWIRESAFGDYEVDAR